MEFLIAWIIWSIFNLIVAHKRGRSVLLWFVLQFIICPPPLATVILLSMKNMSREAQVKRAMLEQYAKEHPIVKPHENWTAMGF